MDAHGGNRQGTTVTRRRALYVALGALAVAGGIGARRHAAWQELIGAAEEQAATERQWIMANQRSDGAIYLNMTDGSGTGDVNPYFAAIAARALIVEGFASEHREAAGRYLQWHTMQAILHEGIVPNFCLATRGEANGDLVTFGEPDSADAYLAQYLLLLEDYALAGGSLADIEGWERAAQVALDRLGELVDTASGLAQTFADSGTCYLMDNVEVLAALDGLDAIGMDSTIGTRIETAIESLLWNADERRYEIGLSNGSLIDFSGLGVYYPDLMAQAYPLAYGYTSHRQEIGSLLGGRELQILDAIESDGSVRDWHLTVLAACLCTGNLAMSQSLFDHYQACSDTSRAYPFHVGNAGSMVLAFATERT